MAFKDHDTDWANVKGGGSARSLPAGGYVAIITAYEDREASNGNDYIIFTYDIAEGEYKGMFADADSWKHEFKRWYLGENEDKFKDFLLDIEASNNDFKVAKWDKDLVDLVGKKIGIVVQRRDYTGNDGADRWKMEVRYCTTADDIRNGRFSVPEPKDERTNPEPQQQTQGSVYDADIPF